MRIYDLSRNVLACTTVFILLGAGALQVLGQQRRPAVAPDADESPVVIRKLEGIGRQSLVKTPQYKSTHPGSTRPPESWGQVVVTYDTLPDWLDDLMFRYHIMLSRSSGGKVEYTILRNTIKYVEIERRRGHMSSVFLRPATLKRYGDVAAVAVSINLGGRVVAESSISEIKGLPPKWWAMEMQKIPVKDGGYILDRSQTPFAFINVDDYEVAQ